MAFRYRSKRQRRVARLANEDRNFGQEDRRDFISSPASVGPVASIVIDALFLERPAMPPPGRIAAPHLPARS